jgi:CRISPR-associated endonuclease/helicase Cas3
MRTLVEQTHAEISTWLANLAPTTSATTPLSSTAAPLGVGEAQRSQPTPASFPALVTLMGGEAPSASPTARDWHLYPERPAILIGTQDMLLSRALRSRPRNNRYNFGGMFVSMV